ncbi:hypothetical protein D3C84_1230750 [compost metagenome]
MLAVGQRQVQRLLEPLLMSGIGERGQRVDEAGAGLGEMGLWHGRSCEKRGMGAA